MATISHLSFSSSGGAGEVMVRLAEYQRTAGWKSDFYSIIDDDLRSRPFRLPKHTIAAATDQWILKRPSFLSPISLTRDRLETSISAVPSSSNLIHLHWINGMTSILRVSQRFPGIKIVWTMHDMNPFTGVCHQSLGCEKYANGCSSCPAVTSFSKSAPSQAFDQKRADLASAPVVLVAPSKWLADQARVSAISRDKQIEVIPNPLSSAFSTVTKRMSRVHGEKISLVLVAKDLADPLKGVKDVVEAHQVSRIARSRVQLVLVGGRGHRWSNLENINWLGELTSDELRRTYTNVDYIVQASQGEAFGLTVIEAASQGASPIVRAGGALEETQKLLQAGSAFSSTMDLCRIFEEITLRPAPTPDFRALLSTRAINTFGLGRVGALYENLYLALGTIK